jgi:hypothetical protein
VLRDQFARDFLAVGALFDVLVELTGRGDLRQARSHTDECCSAPFAVTRTSGSVAFNGRFQPRRMSGSGRDSTLELIQRTHTIGHLRALANVCFGVA